MKFNEPLGIPQGSVRAILTIILIVAYIALTILNKSTDFIGGLVAVAVGYYFGVRQAETQGQPKSEPLDQPAPADLTLPEDEVNTTAGIVPGSQIDKEVAQDG